MKIKEIIYDASEPEHCNINGCKEDINALNCIVIELIPNLECCIWVCDEHKEAILKGEVSEKENKGDKE